MLAFSLVLFALVCVSSKVAPAVAAPPPGWDIVKVQLPTAPGLVWEVDHGFVALSAGEDVTEEVYLYEIATDQLHRITTNGYMDSEPTLGTTGFAWIARNGADTEIMFADYATLTPRAITSDSRDDRWPRLDGTDLVWVHNDGNDGEIYYHDLLTGQTVALTDNGVDDGDFGVLSVDGGLAAWHQYVDDSGDTDSLLIDLHNRGAGTKRFFSSGGAIGWCQVRDGRLAFMLSWDGGSEIHVYDRATDTTTRASAVGEEATFPVPMMGEVFDGDNLVYFGGPSGRDVRLGSAGGGPPLTLSTASDVQHPQMADGLAVWDAPEAGAYEIFVYDTLAETTVRLTDDARDDIWPATGDAMVAWVVEQGGASRLVVAAPASGAPVDERIFVDVPGTHPYVEAIEGLYLLGVVDGTRVEDGLRWFNPENPVLRAQFAKMIVGTLLLPVDPFATSPFTDLGSDPAGDLYPHQFVAAAYANGVTYGTSATSFSPWRQITRAQVGSMMVRGINTTYPGELLAAPGGAAAGTLGNFSPDHALNMWVCEYNGLFAGIVGFGPSWNPWAQATRGEVAQIMWNALVFTGQGLD